MAFRRQPLTVFLLALAIFLLTSILPVSYMLVQFIINLLQEPSASASPLLDSRQLILLGRSLTIAIFATLVALALGLPSAFALAARDLPFRKLFYLLILIPLLIPPYIMAGSWIHLLAPDGFVNKSLAAIFGSSARLLVFSQAGCVWCLGISHFPIIAIILTTGLSKIDRNLQDIARLSTGPFGVFWHSTLPQILPHLAASICLVMIFVLGRYGVPSLLGINTYPVEIFAQFSAFYDENAAIAIALPLMVLVVILILAQRQLMLNRSYASITPSSESDNPTSLHKLKYYAVAFLLALFIITTFLPFASVLSYIGNLGTISATLVQYSSGILITSSLAFLATVISTLIALPIGFHLAHYKNRSGWFLDVICWLPIAIPGTIVGLGLINLGNLAPAVRNADSFGILLLLAHIGMFSAFSVRIFQAAYREADPNIAEVAAVDSCRWYQRLFYIDVPIHSGSIAASFIIVFVLTIGELNATVLLVPPGKETLAVTIDNLLHYGANVKASVLCLAEAALVVLIISLGFLMWNIVKGRK
jgi:iron(III) transport system permease protein